MFKRSETKCHKKKGEYCKLHNPEYSGNDTDRRAKLRFIQQGLAEYNTRIAKGKKPLCMPEHLVIQEEKAERLRKELEERQAEHKFRVDDMKKHMKLTIDPKTGEKTVSVFRAGVPTTPEKRGVEAGAYETTDGYAPEGRQGRNTAVFASPTMNGVTAWVRGVSNVVKDWGVRELRVNPDKVYVYSVRAWEACSVNEVSQSEAENYWRTGITLSDWMKKLNQDPDLDPSQWELLLNEKDIKTVKPVGADRVSRSAYLRDNGERNEHVYDLLTRQLGKKK